MRCFDSAARGAATLGLALTLALLSHTAVAQDSESEAPAKPAESAQGEGEAGTEEPAEGGASAEADNAAEGDEDGEESASEDAGENASEDAGENASEDAGESASEDAGESASEDAGESASEDEDVPANVRLRQLQQDVQGLKERAWRAKARVGMLQDSVLGGGIGSRASIVHRDDMGNAFRLARLVYSLDGTQIFARSGDDLHETEKFDILSGPIAPGSHTLSVLAIYEGHGYGVFRYLDKYKFTVRSSHTFNAAEGKGTLVTVRGYESGGATTPLEDRPAIEFKVSLTDGLDE